VTGPCQEALANIISGAEKDYICMIFGGRRWPRDLELLSR